MRIRHAVDFGNSRINDDLEQSRPGPCQRIAQAGVDVGSPMDTGGGASEGFSHLYEVDSRKVDSRRSLGSQDAGECTHGAVSGIVQDDDRDGQLVLYRRPDRLDGVHR